VSQITQHIHAELGSVRTVEIDGEIWFVGRDVAVALGYSDPAKAIRMHCRGVDELSTMGNRTHAKIIPESDLFRLILRSKLPSAEAFQDWVTMELLPSVRKDGFYLGQSGINRLAELIAKHASPMVIAAAERVIEEQKRMAMRVDLAAAGLGEKDEWLEWLEERVEADPRAQVRQKLLFEDWDAWADEHDAKPITPKRFSMWLCQQNIMKTRKSNGIWRPGVRLKLRSIKEGSRP
jgi:prophage antirepressor-like protein